MHPIAAETPQAQLIVAAVNYLPDLPSRIRAQAERIRVLEEALEPFARIVPSSLYAADGGDGEGYVAMLAQDTGEAVEFTGADLARAALTLNKENDNAG